MRRPRFTAVIGVIALLLGPLALTGHWGRSDARAASAFAFRPSYEPAADRQLIGAERLMRVNKLAERWAASANASFVPPVDVPIQARQCGITNAYYDSATTSITVCYEFAELLRGLFTEPQPGLAPSRTDVDATVASALNGIFFHELGHGLIDLYDLPVTGREEDAVDQLATIVLINSAEQTGDYSDVVNSIETWRRISEVTTDPSGRVTEDQFADEHSLSKQRYYSIMCYLYGSNPAGFQQVVDEQLLPQGRAEGCPAEYGKVVSAWNTLLAPHLRPSPRPSPTE